MLHIFKLSKIRIDNHLNNVHSQ